MNLNGWTTVTAGLAPGHPTVLHAAVTCRSLLHPTHVRGASAYATRTPTTAAQQLAGGPLSTALLWLLPAADRLCDEHLHNTTTPHAMSEPIVGRQLQCHHLP